MLMIKKASEKDSLLLAQIFEPLHGEDFKSEEKIRTNITNGSDEYYLGLMENRPVGAIMLRFEGNQCDLCAIVVKDKGKGYGAELLQFAEDLAIERGCVRIWCFSLVQHGADGFYKKHGWKEEELIKDFCPGLDCFKFSKSLKKDS